MEFLKPTKNKIILTIILTIILSLIPISFPEGSTLCFDSCPKPVFSTLEILTQNIKFNIGGLNNPLSQLTPLFISIMVIAISYILSSIIIGRKSKS